MGLGTLVTHVEPVSADAALAEAAAALALAGASGAHLTILGFRAETSLTGPSEPEAVQLERDKAVRAALAEACAVRSVAASVVERSSYALGVPEVFARAARLADLAVLTLAPDPAPGRTMMLKAALFDTGRPVLLVPASSPLAGVPKRVAVAWDGSAAAARAVTAAGPLLGLAGEAIVISAAGDKADAGEADGTSLAEALSRAGCKARFIAIEARGDIFATLAGAAQGAGCDVLVMGAVRHGGLLDWISGSATRSLIDKPLPMAVLAAG
jgi:nucleotide-binding universal stress UspA family protein